MFKKIRLPNGVRLIIISKGETKTISVLVLTNTGVCNEKKEENGISHFLEHMCFKATKKRKNKKEVAKTMDQIGGIYNAFTTHEYSGYYAKTHIDYFDLALDWTADLYLNSVLPAKEISIEKKIIQEEIRMYQDDPAIYIDELWQKLLYPAHPLGWPIAGTEETIRKINRKKLLNYREKQYVGKNTVVCIAGGINPDQAIKKASNYFRHLKKGKPRKKIPIFAKQSRAKALIKKQKTEQIHVCIGFRSVGLSHPLVYCQDILAVVLGGMMVSRLMMEIREKRGLAYYIYTQSIKGPSYGWLVTHAGFNNEEAKKGIEIVLREYEKIFKKGITSSELKIAKQNIVGKTGIRLESSDALASFYGIQEILKGKIETPEEIFAKIKKVSLKDIRRFVRLVFRKKNLNLAVIGPIKKEKSIKELLNR